MDGCKRFIYPPICAVMGGQPYMVRCCCTTTHPRMWGGPLMHIC